MTFNDNVFFPIQEVRQSYSEEVGVDGWVYKAQFDSKDRGSSSVSHMFLGLDE